MLSSTSGHLHMLFPLSAAIPLATTTTFFHLPSLLFWLISVIILFKKPSLTFAANPHSYELLCIPPSFFLIHSFSFIFICVIFDYLTHYISSYFGQRLIFLILIPEYGCSVNINRLNEEMNKLNLADLFHIHSHYYQQNIFR